jgi:hypothetical protein
MSYTHLLVKTSWIAQECRGIIKIVLINGLMESWFMDSLQKQLDNRLAKLKKNRTVAEKKAAGVGAAQIKATLYKSGILTKSGRVRSLRSA